MKFLRHLAAVTLVVTAVVVLGLVWNHFDASSLGGGIGSRFSKEIAISKHPPGTVALRKPGGGHLGPIVIRDDDGGMSLGLSSMFDAVNRPVVEHTIAIEAAAVAAVVLIDTSRRRARKARRARLLSQYRGGGSATRQPAASAASQAQQEPGPAP